MKTHRKTTTLFESTKAPTMMMTHWLAHGGTVSSHVSTLTSTTAVNFTLHPTHTHTNAWRGHRTIGRISHTLCNVCRTLGNEKWRSVSAAICCVAYWLGTHAVCTQLVGDRWEIERSRGGWESWWRGEWGSIWDPCITTNYSDGEVCRLLWWATHFHIQQEAVTHCWHNENITSQLLLKWIFFILCLNKVQFR